jgi:hypothetical protein
LDSKVLGSREAAVEQQVLVKLARLLLEDTLVGGLDTALLDKLVAIVLA